MKNKKRKWHKINLENRKCNQNLYKEKTNRPQT